MSSLATLFSSLQKGFLKNVLTGAGITLGTSAALLIVLIQRLLHLKTL
ncbi:hypothetical protein ACT4ZY_01100 [Acinetobacter baumannii]